MYSNLLLIDLNTVIYNFCIHNNLSYEECIELTEAVQNILDSAVKKEV